MKYILCLISLFLVNHMHASVPYAYLQAQHQSQQQYFQRQIQLERSQASDSANLETRWCSHAQATANHLDKGFLFPSDEADQLLRDMESLASGPGNSTFAWLSERLARKDEEGKLSRNFVVSLKIKRDNAKFQALKEQEIKHAFPEWLNHAFKQATGKELENDFLKLLALREEKPQQTRSLQGASGCPAIAAAAQVQAASGSSK